MTKFSGFTRSAGLPSPFVSAMPIVFLLTAIAVILCTVGTDVITSYGSLALLGAASVSLLLARLTGHLNRAALKAGMRKSAAQILPAVPLLLLIALIAATWMLSGVVPTLIHYGLQIINPVLFPLVCCLVTGMVAVLTGSSWSSIATIGVAFMGIGEALGYSGALTAGAVISGAYMGDKVSPLSDTTVVASSACGVDIFKHVKYMLVTTVPAMIVTLGAYLAAGFIFHPDKAAGADAVIGGLHAIFNITPWLLIIPAVTGVLIALRLNTLLTLAISSVMGLAAIFIFQDNVIGLAGGATEILRGLWSGTELPADSAMISDLVSTSGVTGMFGTIFLILSAMTFGGTMMGTGMLASLTACLTRRLRRRTSTVGATVGSGLFLICCTADQYLSLIVAGNMYRDHYGSIGLDPRLLSRTIEDSITVTSPLVPWGSCGVTQATVLSVPTLSYAPFAIFCWLSPLITLLVARLGYRITQAAPSELQPALQPLKK